MIKISNKTLAHSTKGDFIYKNRKPVKMKSGGHGEENVNYLKKHNIPFSINSTNKNGVRHGNISIHSRKRNRCNNGQCWFPENWTRRDIKRAGKYLAGLKKNQNKGVQEPMTGTYKGVKIGAYKKNNRIQTIFPWYVQKEK